MLITTERPGPGTPTSVDSRGPDAVRKEVASGSDVDAAADFYGRLYSGRDMVFVPARDGFRFSFRSIGDDRLTLRSSTVAARREGLLHPDRQYLLSWSVGGRFAIETDRHTTAVVEPGNPVMFPSDHPFSIAAPAGTQQFVGFDADFLEAVAAVGADGPARPLRFAQSAPSTMLRGLRMAIHALGPALLDASTPAPERRRIDVELAEALIVAFSPKTATPPARSGKDVVGRAQEFMRDRFDDQLAVTDIAAAACTSVRTLQQAFLVQLETSPMRWLHDLRLAKVREALRLADPALDTVAAIARENGFCHMGRFSGGYHGRYGEYPHETLATP